MIHRRHSYLLKLAAILMPALIAALVAQLPIPPEERANAAPLVVETWNGISDTFWNNTHNWTPIGDPSVSEHCIIPAGKPHYPSIGGADLGMCGSITINSGGQINVQGAILQSSNAIIVNGALSVVNNSVLQAGNLIAVNPGGLLVLNNTGPSSVRFTANGSLSVSGTVQVTGGLTGNEMTGPNPPSQVANLVVNPGGLFDILESNLHEFTLDGSVTNHGTMRETRSVGSPTRFLSITSAYIGLVITPSTSLGNTSVGIQGDQTCSGQPQSVKRCYLITPTVSVSSTVKFFYLSSEANGNNTPSVFHFNTGTASWQALQSTRGGSAPSLFAQAAGITSYSPFELRNISYPSFLPIVRR